MKTMSLAQICSRDYERTVGRVWERFVNDCPVDGEAVRDVVMESWRRCRQQGVDPGTRSAPMHVAGAGVERLQLENADLRDAVRACIPPIVPYLVDSRTILITSDPNGTLLSVDGDPQLTDRMAADHILPGAAWHEYSGGTNAVGTALALGRPLHIHAQEHFCEVAKRWSCAAALIRDADDGRILGAVDVTGPPDTVNAQTWPFVMSLVGQLQSHLLDRRLAERARQVALFESTVPDHEAAVLLDLRGHVVAQTPAARPVLRAHGIDAARLARVLAADRLARDDLVRLAARVPGVRPEWLSPLRHQAGSIGIVLRLPPRMRAAATQQAAPMVAPAFQTLALSSPALVELLRQAERFVQTRTPILLQGETGTGKDVLARALHAAGPGRNGPFVPINCAALPKEILASELFGHGEGAFTGARRGGARGRFEQAQGGVLFLDEIGDMPLDLQPYLLRVLEEGMVWRLGDGTPRRITARVIAATNRPLDQDVAAGRFRADLYHRLNVAALTVPPLRERAHDIPGLAAHLLREVAAGAPMLRIAPEVMDTFRRYRWPGNVRELRNALERMALLSSDGVLRAEHLPAALRDGAGSSPGATATIRDAEWQVIEVTLKREGGNISRAARALGVARTTLYRRLRDQATTGHRVRYG
ncbi:sigma-54-dependent Fis family transcriptional regulator [Vineibacter terrae]|uniref:Sigma-54-dependent Fis family transcriptional regulator n=1 Tax=Vineibacter terrae TaxID=2586908 RepID=A0A5C8PTK3_9HYPH|nr:sigma-54-dependent Fis family transcriptional regulator [Vineibacter terrae]TXL80409.1 sigma-54-dependent Fis family transcriptional regulator [Vineibacter terrae]